MARAGLLKSDVKRARDLLLAQRQHPSADAVRVTLGNTGSKSTIHKYLKELEEEDGGGQRVAVSAPLLELVERLAARLQEEAGVELAAAREDFAIKANLAAETLANAQRDIAALTQRLQQTNAALEETKQSLQQEAIARHTAEQQVVDMRERLAENEIHRLSLEEKHQHARDSLEHYRASVKDQREQDQRRHEQQLQQLQSELRLAQQAVVVKQEEVTRLNQEGARLVADLSHAQKALRDEQDLGRRQAGKIEALQSIEARCSVLAEQLSEREARLTESKEQLTTSAAAANELGEQLQGCRQELAGATAALAAQQELVRGLQTALANLQPKRKGAT